MVDQIREAIRCARIAPGTRLPSSRRLSEQLMISRNTVVRAYDLLLMEGIVEFAPRRGSMWPNCSPASRFLPRAAGIIRSRLADSHAAAAASGTRAKRLAADP